MSELTTYDLIKPYEKKLDAASEALLAKDYSKAAATLTTVVVAAAAGHPEIGLLAPFANHLVARAFESAADVQMREQMEAFAAEDDRRAFVAQITEATAELLDEAVVTIAKIQHRATAQTAAQVEGLRDELKTFRESFARAAEGAPAVHVETQHVAAGATGLRVRSTNRRSVFVKTMHVTGAGSVGIDLD